MEVKMMNLWFDVYFLAFRYLVRRYSHLMMIKFVICLRFSVFEDNCLETFISRD